MLRQVDNHQENEGVSTMKRKPGRPITRRIEIHATAEQIAKAIFLAAKPPDPSRRIVKRPKSS